MTERFTDHRCFDSPEALFSVLLVEDEISGWNEVQTVAYLVLDMDSEEVFRHFSSSTQEADDLKRGRAWAVLSYLDLEGLTPESKGKLFGMAASAVKEESDPVAAVCAAFTVFEFLGDSNLARRLRVPEALKPVFARIQEGGSDWAEARELFDRRGPSGYLSRNFF